ncbi:MAG: hypothetical protein G01um10143_219 [Parcubacteria group bacterium Gr01-1014_3]|nr:MAG: hypothetical protein G01um10143_219 [Parcubacteria group bacterium Gr01-1014_3]
MKNFGELLLRIAFTMICVGLIVLFGFCLPLDKAPIIPMISSLGLMVFGIIFIGIRVLMGADHCEHCACEGCKAETDQEGPK